MQCKLAIKLALNKNCKNNKSVVKYCQNHLMLWLFVQDRPTDNHKFNVRSHFAYSMLGYLLKLSFKIKILYLNNF